MRNILFTLILSLAFTLQSCAENKSKSKLLSEVEQKKPNEKLNKMTPEEQEALLKKRAKNKEKLNSMTSEEKKAYLKKKKELRKKENTVTAEQKKI